MYAHHFTCKRNLAHIKAAHTLNSDQLTFFKMLEEIISIEILTASIIEADFNDPAGIVHVVNREVYKPIVSIHPVTAPCTATAVAFASIGFTCSTATTSHT
ncbi:MAG: hypothetical protein ACXVBX_05510 [Flavisolibacter sp.]